MVQLLVVCAIVAVLAGIVVPVIGKARSAARRAQCLSNLRGIVAAFGMFANDNARQLPAPAFTQIPWERSLQAYAPEGAFVCPGDRELAPATLSSYDWRDTGFDDTTLAGKNPLTARADAVLVFDALPGWHESTRMNVGRVDGSVLPMDADHCVADLRRPVQPP